MMIKKDTEGNYVVSKKGVFISCIIVFFIVFVWLGFQELNHELNWRNRVVQSGVVEAPDMAIGRVAGADTSEFTPESEESENTSECDKCGYTQINEDMNFCPHCGYGFLPLKRMTSYAGEEDWNKFMKLCNSAGINANGALSIYVHQSVAKNSLWITVNNKLPNKH